MSVTETTQSVSGFNVGDHLRSWTTGKVYQIKSIYRDGTYLVREVETAIYDCMYNSDLLKMELLTMPRAETKHTKPDHYKALALEPFEVAVRNGEGRAVLRFSTQKYLARFENKNGLEDLKKASRCLDLLICLEEFGKDSTEMLHLLKNPR